MLSQTLTYLMRNLPLDSDVRQLRHPLMIPLHCLWAKSENRTRAQFQWDVTWFCFCFVFVRSHAPCCCCSIVCLRFEVVEIKQVHCKMSTRNANNITIMFILRVLLSFQACGFWFPTRQFHLCPTQIGRLKRHWGGGGKSNPTNPKVSNDSNVRLNEHYYYYC